MLVYFCSELIIVPSLDICLTCNYLDMSVLSSRIIFKYSDINISLHDFKEEKNGSSSTLLNFIELIIFSPIFSKITNL